MLEIRASGFIPAFITIGGVLDEGHCEKIRNEFFRNGLTVGSGSFRRRRAHVHLMPSSLAPLNADGGQNKAAPSSNPAPFGDGAAVGPGQRGGGVGFA